MTSMHTKQEALLDELLKDYTSPQDILGEHGLLKQLTKRVVERVLEAELTAHLGYAPHMRHGTEEPNARNGKGRKTVQTDTGPVDLTLRCRGGAAKRFRLHRRVDDYLREVFIVAEETHSAIRHETQPANDEIAQPARPPMRLTR